ncbi:hypothetical protein EB001_14595 [bacterium]|nr:hypothetical protein [bacterium]
MSDLIDIGYFGQPGGNSYVEQICPTGEFIKNIEGESSLDYLKKLNFTCSDGTKLSTIGSNSINQPALPVTFSMTYDPAMDHIYGTSDLYVSQLFGNGGKGGNNNKKTTLQCPAQKGITGVYANYDTAIGNINNLGFKCGDVKPSGVPISKPGITILEPPNIIQNNGVATSGDSYVVELLKKYWLFLIIIVVFVGIIVGIIVAMSGKDKKVSNMSRTGPGSSIGPV